MLAAQPYEACKWKYLYIFYIFGPAAVFTWGHFSVVYRDSCKSVESSKNLNQNETQNTHAESAYKGINSCSKYISGFCCCVWVTYFKRQLIPSCVKSSKGNGSLLNMMQKILASCS